MTQVLTLLTSSCVFQVSDRRVSGMSNNQFVWFDDHRNKSVAYLALAAFGYTGTAAIGSVRTDVWMTERLAPTAALGDGLGALRDGATDAFHSPYLVGERLAMVAGGWDPVDEESFVPFLAVVSNFLSPAVRRAVGRVAAVATTHSGARRDHFDARAVRLGDGMTHLLHVAGQPLSANRAIQLLRNVGRALQRTADPTELVRLLAEEIWDVARVNPLVGSSLMAVAIPRTAARRSGLFELMSGPPRPDVISAMYLPSSNADSIYYLPNLAGAGACMVDATLEPLDANP